MCCVGWESLVFVAVPISILPEAGRGIVWPDGVRLSLLYLFHGSVFILFYFHSYYVCLESPAFLPGSRLPPI